MEPQQPAGGAKYQVVVLKAPDPDAVAQIVSERIGKSFAEVRKLVSMAPAVVAVDMDPLPAQDLVGIIKSVGADADKRLIPSSVPCPFHKAQRGRVLCQVCGKVICSLCVKEAKGKPICQECTGEAGKIKIGFPWRKLILFLVLIGVGIYAYVVITRERAKFPWDRPYKLAVVGFMVELPPEWKVFVDKFNQSTGTEYVDLKNHTLPDMVGWFQREYRRYGGTMDKALDLTILGPFDEMNPPPAPPSLEGKFTDRYFQYRAFKTWFAQFNKRHSLDLKGYDGVIYVQFVTGRFDTFVESWASRRDNIGVANCFLDPEMVETDIMIVLHEYFHLLNAKDHYNADGDPVYPEGFVEPFEEIRYPQEYGEIMAGRIPVDANSSKDVTALRYLRVGIYTAAEIGWMDELQLQQDILEKKTPPME